MKQKRRWLGLLVAATLAGATAGCSGAQAKLSTDPLAVAREKASTSTNGEVVGRWLLAEMLSQGGDTHRAEQARARLDEGELKKERGLYASLARAIYDAGHGRIESATDAFIDTLRAARASEDENAPSIAWFATNHLYGLRQSTPGLWARAKAFVEETIEDPGAIGWRARTELVDWWTSEAYAEGKADIPNLAARRYGCVDNLRLAGPFGKNAFSDRRRAFEAERPGPWPSRWRADEGVYLEPHILKVEKRGCEIDSAEATQGGIHYVETYVDLPEARDVIVAVQGAFAIWIDDALVLDRDTRTWGIWPKFGARVRLSQGRHRILARLGDSRTAIRLLAADGRPLDVPSSTDARAPYVLDAPKLLEDPNVLSRFVKDGELLDVDDDVARYVGAYLAHVEGQDDLASVLLEPMMREPSRATGQTLAMAAIYAGEDPIFQEGDAHDLLKELRERAVGKDPGLVWPRLWLILDDAEKRGLFEAVAEVKALADEYQEVPEILQGLAHLYERLGWKAERATTVRLLAERFPEHLGVLDYVRQSLEDDGRQVEADRIAEKIRRLDPESEIEIQRALGRRQYEAAIAELGRLRDLRPDRKDLEERIADAQVRAGMSRASTEVLERALEKNPLDAAARLRLADAKMAAGDPSALRNALADAILRGAMTGELADAIDLVEGTTALEPYRLDGLAIIKEYEDSHEWMAGTAARILDYGVNWVHPDGSSRMLEHEIIRIQSQEAIGRLAEHRMLPGVVLRMRVIKRDGTILEPEVVPGKPTLTMPHLEVGDYIETEHITTQPSDGQFGIRYLGPHWFFREVGIGYFRSELVVISPKDRPLQVELQGEIPPAEVSDAGAVVIHRFRVDRSPASPEEPSSPPIHEFLPTVRVGWGISLEDRLQRLVDAVGDELPEDPRLRRMALAIADEPTTAKAPSEEERARRLYRWVMANIEEDHENDARRVIVGKSGSRLTAYRYLLRLAGIPSEIGVTRDKLTEPPIGPFTEAESFDDFLLRVGGEKPVWMVIDDKFAPFGYLPAEVRGQPIYRLVEGLPTETTPSSGGFDGIVYEADGTLAEDGSARLEITQSFVGRLGMGLRASVEQLAEARLSDVIESRLLSRALPGAKLVELSVENQSDLDKPLVLKMTVDVPELARRRGDELVLDPPLAIQVSQLTLLPSRRTPLLVGEPTYAEVRFALKLPEGAQTKMPLISADVRNGKRRVRVSDRREGDVLILDRLVDIPSGRVETDAYPDLQSFAREADEATSAPIAITLP